MGHSDSDAVDRSDLSYEAERTERDAFGVSKARSVGLSPREHEILQRVAQGKPVKQIARELGISSATVRSYIRKVFWKLDVSSQLEAVMTALRDGILDLKSVYVPRESIELEPED